MNPAVWWIDRQMQVLDGLALYLYVNTVERHVSHIDLCTCLLNMQDYGTKIIKNREYSFSLLLNFEKQHDFPEIIYSFFLL